MLGLQISGFHQLTRTIHSPRITFISPNSYLVLCFLTFLVCLLLKRSLWYSQPSLCSSFPPSVLPSAFILLDMTSSSFLSFPSILWQSYSWKCEDLRQVHIIWILRNLLNLYYKIYSSTKRITDRCKYTFVDFNALKRTWIMKDKIKHSALKINISKVESLHQW